MLNGVSVSRLSGEKNREYKLRGFWPSTPQIYTWRPFAGTLQGGDGGQLEKARLPNFSQLEASRREDDGGRDPAARVGDRPTVRHETGARIHTSNERPAHDSGGAAVAFRDSAEELAPTPTPRGRKTFARAIPEAREEIPPETNLIRASGWGGIFKPGEVLDVEEDSSRSVLEAPTFRQRDAKAFVLE